MIFIPSEPTLYSFSSIFFALFLQGENIKKLLKVQEKLLMEREKIGKEM
jgi:hypothetical protein